MENGMGDWEFVVLEEDAVVFGSWCVVTSESQNIGLAHGDATDVGVEDKVVVKDFCEGFDVSSVPCFVVCCYD